MDAAKTMSRVNCDWSVCVLKEGLMEDTELTADVRCGELKDVWEGRAPLLEVLAALLARERRDALT